jgi:hypothetical protein
VIREELDVCASLVRWLDQARAVWAGPFAIEKKNGAVQRYYFGGNPVRRTALDRPLDTGLETVLYQRRLAAGSSAWESPRAKIGA